MLEIRDDPASLPQVDAETLHRMMDDVSVFGGGPGGAMTRLTLSQEDKAARDWLANWLTNSGLRLETDPMGNMYGYLDWAGPDAPYIMSGSHLDSQPNGGCFDGAYGVIAACAAIDAHPQARRRDGNHSEGEFHHRQLDQRRRCPLPAEPSRQRRQRRRADA